MRTGIKHFPDAALQRRQVFLHRLPDDLQVRREVVMHQFKSGAPAAGVAFDPLNRLEHVLQPLAIISHSGTASPTTRARIRGRRPVSVTTSTLQPRRPSKSLNSPPRSKSDRPGARRTRKSMSLSASASPRATDPKTRRSSAPCLVAIARISARRDARSLRAFTGSILMLAAPEEETKVLLT